MNRKTGCVLVVAILIIAVAACLYSAKVNAKLAPLFVKGASVYDYSGPVFLVGANVGSQAWNPIKYGQWDDWWTYRERDADNIKSYGLNSIRLLVYWEALEKSSSPNEFRYDQNYVSRLKETVEAYNRRGIYVIIDLHRHSLTAGSMLGRFMPMAGGGDGFAKEWFVATGPTSAREHLKRVWLMLSDLFKDDTGVAGYDLCNEPHLGDASLTPQQVADAWLDIVDYVTGALRANADTHMIFVNFAPLAQSAAYLSRKATDPNTLYEPHFYQGIELSNYTVTNNKLDWLREAFGARDTHIFDQMARFNVPFVIGEFGFEPKTLYPGDSRYIWLRNALTVFLESSTLCGLFYYSYMAFGGNIRGDGWQRILTEYTTDKPTNVHYVGWWQSARSVLRIVGAEGTELALSSSIRRLPTCSMHFRDAEPDLARTLCRDFLSNFHIDTEIFA
ncbi:MAG: cellulase family glycosylhydrolase [Candidatus Bathyarchaeia archaeon]|jgi:hypothetical protein